MHSPLSKELRGQLEKAVIKARDIAEQAAIEELVRLSVGDKTAANYLSPDQKQLRNRLRVHGRALGDRRKPSGDQPINHLASEAAYEHWHRMLFARFLAENNLLMYEDGVTALSIQDCFDLADEETGDSANGWQYAAKFATRMLPEVFRVDSPVFDVVLAPNYQKQLEKLLSDLDVSTFSASDSLGWVYQFWQARKKEEVNASGNKIGADELPSVTQLFTEDYMVDFLLDNTLGAWHGGKFLDANPQLAESAGSEDELRDAVALPDCTWSYLRFSKDKDGKWTPAAGTFDGWPKVAKDLKCLDPCMGSGHFVVAMFERLVALRLAEEKLDEVTTISAVIQDNLFGLEIDPRCTQIAAFNLALAAWRHVGYCNLPEMNIACSGLAPNTREAEWLELAGDNEQLQKGMERLYRLFKDAPVLGSLINPHAGERDLLEAGFHELQPLLEKALTQETEHYSGNEIAVTARGIAKAAEILASKFTLVATNVPFLGMNRQTEFLFEYLKSQYPAAKADLATAFIHRCLEYCSPGSSTAIVSPQIWLFLGSYKNFRTNLLENKAWNSIARLGSGAFGSISGEVVNVGLFVISNMAPVASQMLSGFDVSGNGAPDGKASSLKSILPLTVNQVGQLKNPDARVTLEITSTLPLLSKYVDSYWGIGSGDIPRFACQFWEVPALNKNWRPLHVTSPSTCDFTGREQIIDWRKSSLDLCIYDHERDLWLANRWNRGSEGWGRNGVAISQMGDLGATLFSGEVYQNGVAAIIPKDQKYLPAVWALCSSDDFCAEVRKIDKKLSVTNLTLIKIPFDLARWQKVAAEEYPHGLPKPFSSDPTQWLFNGHPVGADQPLHVAMARLLGYQWPRQTGSSFPDCTELGSDGLESLSDDDGIVCLPAVRGEEAAHERIEKLLHASYGNEWSILTRNELLNSVDCENHNLEFWLREKFFEQHCKLFKYRPFIWHIWDGLKDGFSALVNYHKLDKKNLERLIYTYLDDWIRTQKHAANEGVDGADVRMHAAEGLKRRLEQILQGEQPYDIFVRWKPLEEQSRGWDPDLNDGVRMNIRPFMMVDDVGKKGAGVLRTKPNIKWGKDRGKDPTSAPWFNEFGGDRINEHHLSLAMKQAARE